MTTVEGISVSVVEVGGALWSCASWAAGEIYDRLPPELRFLADLTIGCSKIGTEMLAGVWSAVQSAAQAVDDPPAFIQEQIDLALAVKAEIEADPEGFARTMLGEVFDEELYNTNRNQWIGKMTCEAILIVLGTVAGGSGLIARFGPKIARLLDKIDEVLPGRVKRKDDDDDGPNLCGLNSFPTGTQVLMADGTRLAIELVEPGDSVVTYSTTDEVWRTQVVLDQWSHLDNGSMSTVTLTDGSQVTATDHHQFWVANDGQWVELEDVTPGDLLLTPQGVTEVAAVVTTPPTETLVWELDTATDDTFTVNTGTQDLLVHNCGSTNFPENTFLEPNEIATANRMIKLDRFDGIELRDFQAETGSNTFDYIDQDGNFYDQIGGKKIISDNWEDERINFLASLQTHFSKTYPVGSGPVGTIVVDMTGWSEVAKADVKRWLADIGEPDRTVVIE